MRIGGPGRASRSGRRPAGAAALLALALSAPGAGAAPASTPIADVFLDLHQIHKWDDSNGDTWDPFWADDDILYSFNCDGRGFGKKQKNLAFHQLAGDHPHRLVGRPVNSMDAYGAANQKEADGATWKAMGQECIDSVFYAFVSRHTYGNESKDPLMRQTAVNASLIKSADRGKTWTRSAEENYKAPLWPGPRFGGPFFVHYGKNGGDVTHDDAHRYVYAVSPNGFWNGGDDYVLGRVARARLPALDASDWTYYAGGDGRDGASWSDRLDKAAPILSLKAQCGTTPPCFIPALGRYLMVVWYIPTPLKKWFEPREVVYDFYQAEHLWGPWTLIRSFGDRFLVGGHMYGPSLCAKFQAQAGPDVTMSLFTSGCPFDDVPAGLYKLWEIPLVLRTAPVPKSAWVNDTDPRIAYRGTWATTRRNYPVNRYDLHSTNAPDDSLEMPFDGTGIDYVAEKNADHGDVDVFLDGALRKTVSLRLVNMPRLSQVVVFSAQGLPKGRHTIRLVNKGAAYATLDGFRVYGEE
jgi:hypothetical protein